MMTVEIGLTNTGLVTVTATTAITIKIPETYALFARNRTVVLGSIHRRNRTLRRLDLGLETSVDLVERSATPVTSISTLLVHIYSMWPKSKVKTILVVRTN
jgi:hypothetical protein